MLFWHMIITGMKNKFVVLALKTTSVLTDLLARAANMVVHTSGWRTLVQTYPLRESNDGVSTYYAITICYITQSWSAV